MWLAAQKVYPGRRFDKYAVLGDDVLIADSKMGPVYADILRRLGGEDFII